MYWVGVDEGSLIVKMFSKGFNGSLDFGSYLSALGYAVTVPEETDDGFLVGVGVAVDSSGGGVFGILD
jgi:hypothetical protein